MSKKITNREKITQLLKLAKMSAKMVSDPSVFSDQIKEYERLLFLTDDEIEDYVDKMRSGEIEGIGAFGSEN